MQTLWSRALQARSSCRCTSCLHTTTTIARRTTTAASKRQLRVSDVFTACYSTILGTAVFMDARVKEDRRKEWDRLIEEVKMSSKPRKEFYNDSDVGSSTENDWLGQEAQESITNPSGSDTAHMPTQELTTYNAIRNESPTLPQAGEKLSKLDWSLRDSTAERIAMRDVDSCYHPGLDAEGRWTEELFDPDIWNREPLLPLHITKMERTTLGLINRLLKADSILVKSRVFPEDFRFRNLTENVHQQDIFEMKEKFNALGLDEARFPRYDYQDMEIVNQEREKLHQSLWTLSLAASNGQIGPQVALMKMCYNMLVCTAPPSIHTYNLLLSLFTVMGRLDLANIVVESLLHRTRLRPNKRTLRLLLDYYRETADYVGFRETVQKMRGEETSSGGRGLHIRRRKVSELIDGQVENWAVNNKVMHRGKYLHQKAPRSRPIFESLITGSLELCSIRAAVRHTRSALREGFGVSSGTLCAVIKCVVDRLDAYAGASLLKALISQWDDPSTVSVWKYSKSLRFRVYQLLELCGIHKDSLQSTRSVPLGVKPTSLYCFWWYIEYGKIADAIESSATFTVELDVAIGMSGLDLQYTSIKLRNIPPSEPHDAQRLDWALQTIRKHEHDDSMQQVKVAREKRKLLRVQVLANMVTRGTNLVLLRESELLEILIDTKKSKLQSMMCKTLPIDSETASMYVHALTTPVAPQPKMVTEGKPLAKGPGLATQQEAARSSIRRPDGADFRSKWHGNFHRNFDQNVRRVDLSVPKPQRPIPDVDHMPQHKPAKVTSKEMPSSPIVDVYPMFQHEPSKTMSKDMPYFRDDPLRYIENNLFDVNSQEFAWITKRMLDLCANNSVAAREEFTLLRVRNIKQLLAKHLYPNDWRRRVYLRTKGRIYKAKRAQEEQGAENSRSAISSRTNIEPEMVEALETYTNKQLQRLGPPTPAPKLDESHFATNMSTSKESSKSDKLSEAERQLSSPSTTDSKVRRPRQRDYRPYPAPLSSLPFPIVEPVEFLPMPVAAAAA